MKLLGLALAICALGCGFGDYTVVRVKDGRAREGRFVSSEAYGASLEAAMAAEHGDWAGALSWLQQAREADPDDADLVARTGQALCHLGKEADAMKAFEEALKLDPASERAFTERAACRLLAQQPDLPAIRSDLKAALAADPESLDAALMLVELDLREGKLTAARGRAEEATVLHPTAASAWRTLAVVAARQGELARAAEAALSARRYDPNEGKRAFAIVLPLLDEAGMANLALRLRGLRPLAATSFEDAGCGPRIAMLSKIAAHADGDAIAIASEGVRAACPEGDAAATKIELAASWSPGKADEIEARAAKSTDASVRRWGARMRLRRLPLDALPDALPRAEDRDTLALELASTSLALSLKKQDDGRAFALAKAAHQLSPAEPTVARVLAEIARRGGKPANDPWRLAACALSRTQVEKEACAK